MNSGAARRERTEKLCTNLYATEATVPSRNPPDLNGRRWRNRLNLQLAEK